MAKKFKVDLYTKIIFVYVFLIIIPITYLILTLSSNTIREIESNYISLMIDNNQQINERINLIISDIDRISSLSVIDDEAQRILYKDYDTTGLENHNDRMKMNKMISITSTLSPFFYDVIFVSNYGHMYTNLQFLPTELVDTITNIWIPMHDKNQGKRLIAYTYVEKSDLEYISISRRIVNSINFRGIGYVFVNVKLKDLKQSFEKTDKLTDNKDFFTNTVILNDDMIIYHSETNLTERIDDDEFIGFIKSNWKDIENKNLQVSFGDRRFAITGTKNKETGWYIVQYIPRQYISEYTINALFSFLSIILPLLFVFIFIGYYFTNKIVAPVQKLRYAMKSVESGKFNIIINESKKAREIEELYNSYNTMVMQLERTIQQKYISEMNQRNTEFKMLQAQVNPHFLYNTLGLMSAMAELEGVENISVISTSLANIFRYSISAGNLVLIRQELEQVNNYMTIQQMRYYNKIEFNVSISEDLANTYMLKFLFQPIIENAIYHGIVSKTSMGRIEMIFTENQGAILIQIIDDGIGMGPEAYKGIVEGLRRKREIYFQQDKYEHIGLENIHFRIKDFYGEAYGLTVKLNEIEGITIEIRIPIIKEGE